MIYWKDADFTPLLKSDGNRKYKHSLLVGAFDIETTTIYYSADYEVEELRNKPHFAYMYTWQFAVNDISVYGRTWDEFTEFLLNLRADLRLKIDHKLIVFVHNLKFEFAFMKKVKGIYFDETDFIARDRNEVIKCVVNDVFEFRDSYAYTEMSLEQMGELINFQKLKNYNYALIRTNITPLTSTELLYCEHDVLILTQYFNREADRYGYVANVPLTATRCVKRLIFDNYRRDKWFGSGKNTRLSFDSENDMYVLDLLKSAYSGGFLYTNDIYENEVLNDIVHADVSSFYPSIMLFNKFPQGKFEKIAAPDSLNDLFENPTYSKRPLLIKLELRNLKNKYPRFAFLHSNNTSWFIDSPKLHNNHILAAKAITLTVNEIDLKNIIKYYTFDTDTVEIVEVYAAKRYSYLPRYIVKTVIDLYKEKKRQKEIYEAIKVTRPPTVEESHVYHLAKSMLDRIYGIFVQRPILMQYGFDNQSGCVVPLGEFYAKSDSDNTVLYQWGVWIVSYGRDIITKKFAEIGLTTINGVNKNIDAVLYSDTDCLKFFNNQQHINILSQYNADVKENLKKLCLRNSSFCRFEELEGIGEFTFEHYKQMKIGGIKKYCYVNDNDDFYPVVSGLSSDNTYFSQFKTNEEKLDAFDENMEIPAEQARNRRNKYVTQTITKTVIDYLGQPCEVQTDSFVLLSINGFNSVTSPKIEKVDISPEKIKSAFSRKPIKNSARKKE